MMKQLGHPLPQTCVLPKEKPVFRGLMFCTETGVLNYGHAVVEILGRIVGKVVVVVVVVVSSNQ